MKKSVRCWVFPEMIGATIILLNSCSPSRAAEPSAPVTVPKVPVSNVTSNNWSPRLGAAAMEYLIADNSSISISNDSSHTSSFQTTTLYSLSFVAIADSFSLIAKVDSTNIYSNSPSAKTGADKISSSVMHAVLSSTGQLSALREESSASCEGGVDPVAMRVFELTQSYPKQHIKIGDKWTDTISATSCRGKISLHQQVIREYELLELTSWKQHDVAKVQQHVLSTITGNGSDPQNHISAIGSGRSSVLLYLDRASGFLRESEGHSESTLTITTSRGTYPFTQNVVTHIELK